jgi:hypothetical protein
MLFGKSELRIKTPNTALPVSKMTVKCCSGDPMLTLTKYCVPWRLKTGMSSSSVSALNAVNGDAFNSAFKEDLSARCVSFGPVFLKKESEWAVLQVAVHVVPRKHETRRAAVHDARKALQPML